MYKYSTRIVVVYFSFYILITFIKGFYFFFIPRTVIVLNTVYIKEFGRNVLYQYAK